MKKENVNYSKITLYLVVILFIVSISACQKENGTANLKVTLIDAPANYQEVNIDIKEIQINSSDVDTGFVSLEMETIGIVNLLELTGGFEAILSDTEIPVGRINQIRLILGDENTLKVDGEIVNLTIPSGSTSGLKVKVGIDVLEGESYKIVLDFDASKSIVKAGNSGKYNLKPVIRTIVESEKHGRITGSVNPVVIASVSAIFDGDTLSTFTNDEGQFDLKGVDVGTYKVLIEPDSISGLSQKIIDKVIVVSGEITDLAVVDLN